MKGGNEAAAVAFSSLDARGDTADGAGNAATLFGAVVVAAAAVIIKAEVVDGWAWSRRYRSLHDKESASSPLTLPHTKSCGEARRERSVVVVVGAVVVGAVAVGAVAVGVSGVGVVGQKLLVRSKGNHRD